jgi:prefoldin subunit 5
MDSHIALSLGSLLSAITLFFAWHKDAKETAQKIQKLETQVEMFSETKRELESVKEEISYIKQTLVRVDTKLDTLLSK